MFFGLWPFGYVAVYGDQCTQCKEARQSHLPILAHGHTSLHHPSHERRWKTKKWQTKNFKKTAISQPNNQHQLVPLWPYACNHYSRLIKVVVIFVISLVFLLTFYLAWSFPTRKGWQSNDGTEDQVGKVWRQETFVDAAISFLYSHFLCCLSLLGHVR